MDKIVVVDEQLMNALWNDFYKEEDKWDKLYASTKNNDNWYLVWRPWMQVGFESAIGTIARRLEGENKNE